jgi:hypothetical protein
MKDKLVNEYYRWVWQILKTKLNSKYKITAINTLAVLVLVYSFGIVNQLKKETEKQLLNEMNHMCRIIYLASCIIIIIIIVVVVVSISFKVLYISVTVTHFCGCSHWNTHFNFFMLQHHEHHGAAIIHSSMCHEIQIKQHTVNRKAGEGIYITEHMSLIYLCYLSHITYHQKDMNCSILIACAVNS